MKISEHLHHKLTAIYKQAYTVIKSENASFTHIDVHFGKGGDNSAAKLENAAATQEKGVSGSS